MMRKEGARDCQLGIKGSEDRKHFFHVVLVDCIAVGCGSMGEFQLIRDNQNLKIQSLVSNGLDLV